MKYVLNLHLNKTNVLVVYIRFGIVSITKFLYLLKFASLFLHKLHSEVSLFGLLLLGLNYHVFLYIIIHHKMRNNVLSSKYTLLFALSFFDEDETWTKVRVEIKQPCNIYRLLEIQRVDD